MKKITELNYSEARAFFLKEESYFNFDLPSYFNFKNILSKTDQKLTGHNLSDFFGTYNNENGENKPTYPCDCENVNYTFLSNKDGKYAWRPFQLIHPAIYVSLVHKITEEINWNLIVSKFEEYGANKSIRCYSLPLESESKQSDQATSVTKWWQKIEQQSIELGLKYSYVLHTDISDCYGSIYTHSIPWALHTKPIAKENRKKKGLLGNIIDKYLQDMAYGQTNGIPQGSVLMDFMAEIVLGYSDSIISKKIEEANISDYEVLRYRDDYRIFSNNPQDIERLAKILSDTIVDLGLKLNSQKTISFNDIISSSIKPDKIYWNSTKQGARDIQKHLLLIHSLSTKFPNSGSLSTALNKFFNRIKKKKKLNNPFPIISILVDIMVKNPRIYPIATAILSKLLTTLDNPSKREEIIDSILTKFEDIPNTAHIKIWLQRLTLKANRNKSYDEPLCHKVNNDTKEIWNSNWLCESFKNLINTTSIIDQKVIDEMPIIITKEEVELFKTEYNEEVPKQKPEQLTNGFAKAAVNVSD